MPEPTVIKQFAKTGLHIFLKERAAELVGVDIDEDGAQADAGGGI